MVQGPTERNAADFFCNITLALSGSPTPHIAGEHQKGPPNGGSDYLTPIQWKVPYVLQLRKNK